MMAEIIRATTLVCIYLHMHSNERCKREGKEHLDRGWRSSKVDREEGNERVG